MIVTPEEIAAAQLAPHFDAVRDTFASFEPETEALPGMCLDKLRRTMMVVDPSVHDTGRHFGRCRDDGLLIELAPECVQLPYEQLVAIISHELGHAADFAYPGCWVSASQRGGEAIWIGHRMDRPARAWRGRLWHERSEDQIEWNADAIAYAVTGLQIGYCGSCMVQCFGGRPRPPGLR